ncbi:MAG TPA: hypothetical protein VKA15_16725 [Isosphaeraceae bacterium]|nr:hypothetical protein [Isosphaeraceae bacterium]
MTEQFLTHYRVLPEHVREQARQAYALFLQDPHHPSLRFRRVHPTRPIFSARVGIDYRVVGMRDGNDIFWFWIGSHSEYDRLLKQF